MFYRHEKQQQAGPGLGRPCKNNGAGAELPGLPGGRSSPLSPPGPGSVYAILAPAAAMLDLH